MIESRIKNQQMIRNVIHDFVKIEQAIPNRNIDLLRFVHFLSKRMQDRCTEEDCYFIDMLEDIEKTEF